MKLQEIDAIWAALAEQSSRHKELLEESLKTEKEKESLRVEFARLAKELAEHVASVCRRIKSSEFGKTLVEVSECKEKLEEDSEICKEELNSRMGVIFKNLEKQNQLGVSDNPHTSIGKKELDLLSQRVLDALEERHQKYEKELERQRKMEQKRIEFAEAAEMLVTLIASENSAINAMTGEPEQLSAQISERFAEGSVVNGKLQEIQTLFNECIKMEITENKVSMFLSIFNICSMLSTLYPTSAARSPIFRSMFVHIYQSCNQKNMQKRCIMLMPPSSFSGVPLPLSNSMK